ncbi:MAG TPA: hypothetical protein VGN64_18150 [Dyadobacter sp.]|jgi:hypothetical protein|nr:hypothetical protein [Dyadobacter sp.]
MDNLPTFVNGIVRLWNVNLYREQLYKQAMSMDNAGSLRKVYSHGYISSLLFKKEIQWVYDGIKCSLLDGDISKKDRINRVPAIFAQAADKLSIARIMRDQEQKTIRVYKAIRSGILLSADDDAILSDHLDKLIELDSQINKELAKSYEYLRYKE